MKIALAQINPTVGDLRGNSRKIVDFATRAQAQGADLAVFPELCVIGYPPQDLIENPIFLEAARHAVEWIAAQAPPELGLILGAPVANTEKVGKVTRAQLEEIATTKQADLTAADMDAAVRTIAGTARSMGLNVEGL